MNNDWKDFYERVLDYFTDVNAVKIADADTLFSKQEYIDAGYIPEKDGRIYSCTRLDDYDGCCLYNPNKTIIIGKGPYGR